MATERHEGAWQWKCAAANRPPPVYVPLIVCTHVPSGPREQPATPSAHLGTSYSTGEAMPHVTRRSGWWYDAL
eukprot:7387492-Prymnesium_polylepis.2